MESGVSVIVGVDTHAGAHVGVALDHLGRRIGEAVVPNDVAGYRRLLEWAPASENSPASASKAREATEPGSLAS